MDAEMLPETTAPVTLYRVTEGLSLIASCPGFMVVNGGVIRPLTGEISAGYLTVGDPQERTESRCSAGDVDTVATGRLRVGGRRHAGSTVRHALIASNGPSDSLTWDVLAPSIRQPAAERRF